tara:strand:- start:37 stop:468 length:432 start_codon:yes stop_codon:yes gene_type:complete
MSSTFNHFNYKAGLGAVGQYQMSGIPFVTASFTIPAKGQAPLELEFPAVTKFFTIVNTNAGTSVPIRFGFSTLGTTGSAAHGGGSDNYFVLDNGESYTAELRVAKLFILSDAFAQSSASVVAGLTGIDAGSLGLNWSGSNGVG